MLLRTSFISQVKYIFSFLYSSRKSLPLAVMRSVRLSSSSISPVSRISFTYLCVARVSRLVLLASFVLLAASSERASRRFATISKYARLSCAKQVPARCYGIIGALFNVFPSDVCIWQSFLNEGKFVLPDIRTRV